MQVEQWQTTVVNFFIAYGFQIVGAFIILGASKSAMCG